MIKRGLKNSPFNIMQIYLPFLTIIISTAK